MSGKKIANNILKYQTTEPKELFILSEPYQ